MIDLDGYCMVAMSWAAAAKAIDVAFAISLSCKRPSLSLLFTGLFRSGYVPDRALQRASTAATEVEIRVTKSIKEEAMDALVLSESFKYAGGCLKFEGDKSGQGLGFRR